MWTWPHFLYGNTAERKFKSRFSKKSELTVNHAFCSASEHHKVARETRMTNAKFVFRFTKGDTHLPRTDSPERHSNREGIKGRKTF